LVPEVNTGGIFAEVGENINDMAAIINWTFARLSGIIQASAVDVRDHYCQEAQ